MESKNEIVKLIERCITIELSNIAASDQTTTIFREESVATKLISKYFSMRGKAFVSSLLNPLLQTMSTQGSFEIDPTKAAPGEDFASNVMKLSIIANDFFYRLVLHADHLPL